MNRQPVNREFTTDYSDVINEKMNEKIYNIPRQQQNLDFFKPETTRTSNTRNQNPNFGNLSVDSNNYFQQIDRKQHIPISFQPQQTRQEFKTNFNRQRSWQIHQEPYGYTNVKQNLNNQNKQYTSIDNLYNRHNNQNNQNTNIQQHQFNFPRQQNALFQPNQNNHQLPNNYLDFRDNNFNQRYRIQTNDNKSKMPNRKELANKKMQSRGMIPNFSAPPIVRNNGNIVPDRIRSHSSSQEF